MNVSQVLKIKETPLMVVGVMPEEHHHKDEEDKDEEAGCGA